MDKKPWQSKTLLLNFVMAICALFIPSAGEYIKAHPEMVMAVFSGANILLRLITKGAIVLVDD